MGGYHVDRPKHGREMLTGNTPKTSGSSGPHAPVPGAPTRQVLDDMTPIPVDPPTVEGENPHLDVEETLRLLYKHVAHIRRRQHSPPPAESSASLIDLEELEKKLSRGSKLGGLITGLISAIVSIFIAGMAVAALKDTLATDNDIREAIVDHNEVDPTTRDPQTWEQVGTHPVFKKRLDEARSQINAHANDIAVMKATQLKMELRNEYQFEFARWQARINECARTKSCKAPEKPDRLEQIERDLLLGK